MQAAVTFFGMGVPYAGPHDYDNAPMWPAVFLFIFLPFLIALLVSKSPRRSTKPEFLQLLAGRRSCDYCGRESDEAVEYCFECGTPFPAPQPEPEPLLQYCSEIGGA